MALAAHAHNISNALLVGGEGTSPFWPFEAGGVPLEIGAIAVAEEQSTRGSEGLFSS
eukprot:CAMPEP_0182808958 /NCGR_PEP_ID=MMETSP0006_2-20121128/6927_1 /TAXON_ID=97485 /ORGANISM="Prymnesium parvum, Strain Texoma1" /LENGTH=56 /DNA_ID=CAMNT_0024934709 /DNA_START=566 /DNA_END=737 /DNA_ORIENTATION=-